MTKSISALKARQNLGRVLNESYYKGLSFVVERAKKPMVAIVPIDEFLAWQKRKAKLSQIIRKAAERVDLPEKPALELVREAREKAVKT